MVYKQKHYSDVVQTIAVRSFRVIYGKVVATACVILRERFTVMLTTCVLRPMQNFPPHAMSVFDLFRGFFGFPGGHYRADGRRDPFFDGMTHDDDEDYDEEDGADYGYGEDGSLHRGGGDARDPFDRALRFGFSFGPGGVRVDEPPLFGQVLREMEEVFSQLGQQQQHGILPPPSREGPDNNGQRSSSGNALRDSMLKAEEDAPRRPRLGPSGDEVTPSPTPRLPSTPFHGASPFSKFNDIWKQGPQGSPGGHKEDGDLDSAVASGGLDQILAPPTSESPRQPWSRSFFKSVTVTKVVKPDGSVEERRTVRDGQGNEETTVMRSDAPGNTELPDNRDGPLMSGGGRLFPDLRDDGSIFSRFFGGFR